MSESRDDRKAAALSLRSRLDEAYSAFDCRKALDTCGGDPLAAAKWLASGAWMQGRLITWDEQSLRGKAALLAAETQMPESLCLEALRHCGGSITLTRRKLAGQPLVAP